MAETENNITKLVRALVEPAQGVENALQQLLTERLIDTAVGYQLDILGKIAGQTRDGLDDETYRRYIRARIAANNSDGNVEDLIKVADLVIYDDAALYEVNTHRIATVVLRLKDKAISQTLADSLIRFLRDTVSGAVRVILEYSDQAPSTWFKWDTTGKGWDTGSRFIDAKD